MWGRIRSILSSPVFIHEHEKTRLAHVLRVTLLSLLVITVLNLVGAALLLPRPHHIILPGVVTITFITCVWFLVQRGYVRASSWLWISLLWVLVTLLMFPFDGVGSAVLSAYVLPILFAALLLGRQAANRYTALSVAASFAILLGSLSDIIPRDLHTYDSAYLVVRWLVNSMLFVIVATITQQTRIYVNETLHHAQDSARALADAQALLRAAVDQSPAGIVIADAPDVQIRVVNQAALAIRGGSAEGLTEIAVDEHSRRWQTYHLDGVTPYDPAELPLSRAIMRGEVVNGEEVIIRHENGENRRVSANAAPVYNADGSIRAGVVVFLDITERHQGREALERYANRLELLRKIDQTILGAETTRAIAQAALGHMSLLIPYQEAAVSLFDYGAQQGRLLGWYVSGETHSTANLSFSLEGWDDLLETLWKGDKWIISDLERANLPASWSDVVQTEGIRSAFLVPLLIQDELIGTLSVCATQPRAFTTEHIEIAGEIANELAIAIQQAQLHERIRFHAAELERRVTERTLELRRANEHLMELSRAKDRFVSNVSHELRTPITNLKLRQHLLNSQPEMYKEHLDVLRRETDRLEELIENLLILSRLDQDRITFDAEPVDLNELVAEYVSDRVSMAHSRELSLEFEPTPDLPMVSGDWHLIGQVLSILLTNAMLYTPARGQIHVRTCRGETSDRGRVGFCIQDTGPGIAPDEREKLFTRFFRGSVGLRSGVSGTGLGLAIAQEIIDQHQGTMTVESTGVPGQGTTFTVWLPETRQNL